MVWCGVVCSWLGGQFLEVLQDPNEIERLVHGWHKLMTQLEKQFREAGATKPAAVAADTLKHITAFKEHVPLIQWLRSPGLYQRHWERISKILNKQLDPENLTLQQVLYTTNPPFFLFFRAAHHSVCACVWM